MLLKFSPIYIGLIVFFTVIFCGNKAFSQIQTNPSSFTINGNMSDAKKAELTLFISQANLESFRLKNEIVNLEFEDGFTVSLIPGNQMAQFGVNPETYQVNFPSGYKLPSFSISPDGHLLAKVHSVTTKE